MFNIQHYILNSILVPVLTDAVANSGWSRKRARVDPSCKLDAATITSFALSETRSRAEDYLAVEAPRVCMQVCCALHHP